MITGTLILSGIAVTLSGLLILTGRHLSSAGDPVVDQIAEFCAVALGEMLLLAPIGLRTPAALVAGYLRLRSGGEVTDGESKLISVGAEILFAAHSAQSFLDEGVDSESANWLYRCGQSLQGRLRIDRRRCPPASRLALGAGGAGWRRSAPHVD